MAVGMREDRDLEVSVIRSPGNTVVEAAGHGGRIYDDL